MIQWHLQKVAWIYIPANLKNCLSSDCGLKLGHMKLE